jgi:hypothetical protein
VPLVRDSTVGDPLPSSFVAGVLTSPATMNGVMPLVGPTNRPRFTCVLGMLGAPNGGSGGPSSDGPGDLGGDSSMGRYCGAGVAALCPLLRGRRCRGRAGAQCGGALHGGVLPFLARSRQIK